jgi:hypothetical protein
MMKTLRNLCAAARVERAIARVERARARVLSPLTPAVLA